MMTQRFGELVDWSSVPFDLKSLFPNAELGMSPEVTLLCGTVHNLTVDSRCVLGVRPEEPVAAVGGRFHQVSAEGSGP